MIDLSVEKHRMAPSVTKVIFTHEDGAIDQAVEYLISGKLVALPTETVYGLAADASNHIAVQHIYTTKGRPSNNPLICHVANIAMAEQYVSLPPIAKKLMAHFWPGPLTFVLPQKPDNDIPVTVSANLPTLAVRCPATDTTRAIIQKLGKPIAAPSANASGKLSPTCAADVLETLDGRLPLILDGGTTRVGIESTIIGIDTDTITLLRPGTITADDISAISGLPVFDRDENHITAPGQLKSHYAPNAAVTLNATNKSTTQKNTTGQTGNEILIGFGDIAGDMNLSASGNLAEAATNLFTLLRKADKLNPSVIRVAPIPQHGIGIAINDRLKRASAPRNT